ncbi:hypothetical protein Hdeb2414_s0006g00212441 [Helianthus debilis subsp. tardiflorus]
MRLNQMASQKVNPPTTGPSMGNLKEFLPIKEMIEDSKDEREISSVTEDYMRPIVQETIPRRDCECYNCDNILEGVVAYREELRTNKINVKSQIKDSEEMQELVNSYMDNWRKVSRLER